MSSQFRSEAKPTLTLVPAKLLKNWKVEYAKFLDIDNPKQNLKIYIEHWIATFNKRIEMPKRKKMMTPRGIQSTTNAFNYLIIISPTSYKNNILYYFSIHETDFDTISRKKRKNFVQIWQPKMYRAKYSTRRS